MRHSAAHVMAEAVLDLFPGTKLGIGPAIDDGFYYDFAVAAAADARRPRRDRGADGRRASPPTTRSSGASCRPTRAAPSSSSADQPFKVEILDDLAAQGRARRHADAARRRVYEHGPFVDLCKGPHVASTGQDRAVQAARRGRRVLARRPDAPGAPARSTARSGRRRRSSTSSSGAARRRSKRDHRRLGVQLDLFSFHDVSPGCGVLASRRAGRSTGRSRTRCASSRRARGYQEIYTPPLVHKKLWEQSGHWDLYRENMFLVESEEQTFSLKPMNCPESTYIYKSRVRSYRDLPLRLVRIREAAPERAVRARCPGLTRVRHFVTDDAHIYVRPDQIGVGDRGAAGRGPRGVLVVRADAAVHVRDAAGQGARRPRAVGATPRS